MPREPVPPPAKPRLSSYDISERILQCVLRWNKLKSENSDSSEVELDNLKSLADMLNDKLSKLPMSPPPPLRKS